MKITQLETIRLGEFPNILWVRLHTDEGLWGWVKLLWVQRPSKPICTNGRQPS